LSLSRLNLTNFRNYTEATLAPAPGFVVLAGENGAGKTNVLEAVSLLAPGRGLRGAALGDIARQEGPGGMGISAMLSSLPLRGGVGDGDCQPTPTITLSDIPHPNPSVTGEGLINIGTGTLATAPERRIVRINGATASANALSEWLSIVWLTPAMDRLFTEGAGERRRFLDRLVLALEPAHARHAARYEAAIRQRNRLLSEEGVPDADWLTALETQMVEHGLALAEARARMICDLAERLADAPEGPFARAGVTLEGWNATDAATFAQDLRQGRARDAGAARTLIGPHRSDLAVTHLGKRQPAARCSTGEQKALLVGIVLAHADLVAERVQRRPILLLDEVAAHLDPSRRAALFERLAAGGGQVWMTGTERALFSGLGMAVHWFEVRDGRISASLW
jgi:DNA replication and repair protein RecF